MAITVYLRLPKLNFYFILIVRYEVTLKTLLVILSAENALFSR